MNEIHVIIIIIIIIITTVVGVLGTVANNLGKHPKSIIIGVTAPVELLHVQKTTLLGTARILRKVLKA